MFRRNIQREYYWYRGCFYYPIHNNKRFVEIFQFTLDVIASGIGKIPYHAIPICNVMYKAAIGCEMLTRKTQSRGS